MLAIAPVFRAPAVQQVGIQAMLHRQCSDRGVTRKGLSNQLGLVLSAVAATMLILSDW